MIIWPKQTQDKFRCYLTEEKTPIYNSIQGSGSRSLLVHQAIPKRIKQSTLGRILAIDKLEYKLHTAAFYYNTKMKIIAWNVSFIHFKSIKYFILKSRLNELTSLMRMLTLQRSTVKSFNYLSIPFKWLWLWRIFWIVFHCYNIHTKCCQAFWHQFLKYFLYLNEFLCRTLWIARGSRFLTCLAIWWTCNNFYFSLWKIYRV